MNVAELDMPRWVAHDEARKWRAGQTTQDKLIAKAYRTIARGGKVIDLHESFRIAGLDAKRRPALAIARADATTVTLSLTGSSITFSSNRGRHPYVYVPLDVLPGVRDIGLNRAKVPIIPPLFRRCNLAKFWILFEAEWETVTKDPILLEHLGGSLYRVVAKWDLTPIEQAVLKGRR